uniref:AMP-binding enzyme C-terminal domain-containing protein n=1 Tax=Paramoeba aestuarina TaxID=180227 RepID=A0A7S4NKX1_9EUKA|mmetsp:Transcript_19136/g.29978  ORF Transcript_19136/g.29978 Transcript_19136/m.29978 type:complete len:201 (+) Transcript_19136:74-676(+)
MVVRGIDREDKKTYLVECEEGEPGQIITRGKNVMTSYVGIKDCSFALHDDATSLCPWYVNLGDVAFWLHNEDDKERKDYYWVARTSALLIKGGANYSYEQISTEIQKWLEKQYHLTSEDLSVAVVGLNLTSEHEDDCCVMIELLTDKGKEKEKEMKETILPQSKPALSKGSQINVLKFGKIPRNFKGAVLNNDLKKMFKE